MRWRREIGRGRSRRDQLRCRRGINSRCFQPRQFRHELEAQLRAFVLRQSLRHLGKNGAVNRPQPAPSESALPANVVEIYRGAFATALSCTPKTCIAVEAPEAANTQHIVNTNINR